MASSWSWFVVAGASLAACGGGPSSAVERGRELVTKRETLTGGVSGCVSCHSTLSGKNGTGPTLAGIGEEARSRFAADGKASAEEWLRDAVVNPDEDLSIGYQGGVMPANYGSVLTERELDDIVAFLETL